MKVLFASSGIGLGHVVRDFYLSSFMNWADITWITSGAALKYLEARKVKIHEVAYNLERLDKIIEGMFENGTLRVKLNEIKELYDTVKKNSVKLKELVNLDDFGGIVADEFWEFLLLEKPDTKIAFLTDFLRFKPQLSSITQLLLIPSVKKALHKKLSEFDARIYVGLKPVLAGGFEFYGQVFTHEGEANCTEEENSVLINIGGTFAGYSLLSRTLPILNKLKLNFKIIGSSHYFTPNPLYYICSSKLIISMAGYSSLIELSRFKKRGIIVPLSGDFEQTDNAEVFKNRQGYRILPFNKVKEELLERYVQEVLEEDPKPPMFKDGSKKISEKLRYIFFN